MNFADLRNQPDTNMQVFGTVQQIFGIEYTQAKGTKKQGAFIIDDAGEKQKVTIYPGNNPILEQFHVNQRLEFSLSVRPGQGVHVGKWFYGGFWQCPNPQETQQPPQGYQAPPPQQQSQNVAPPTQYQPPPQAAPPQNVQQGADWTPERSPMYAYESAPHVQASIQRSVALEAASRVAIGRTNLENADILSLAILFYDWLSTGNVPTTPVPEPGNDESAF